MDPAQLHQRLDLLLRTSSSSSSSISHRRKALKVAAAKRPPSYSRSGSSDNSSGIVRNANHHHHHHRRRRRLQDSSSYLNLPSPATPTTPYNTASMSPLLFAVASTTTRPTTTKHSLSMERDEMSLAMISRLPPQSSLATTSRRKGNHSPPPPPQQETNVSSDPTVQLNLTVSSSSSSSSTKTTNTNAVVPTATTATTNAKGSPQEVTAAAAKTTTTPTPTTTLTTTTPSPLAVPVVVGGGGGGQQRNKLPKLTLSAFRRPEETIRLTGEDWDTQSGRRSTAGNISNTIMSHGSGNHHHQQQPQQPQQQRRRRQLENEYDLRGPGCKVIGHGAFSTVRSARRRNDNNNTMVAVKSLSKFDALRARRLRRPGSQHLDEWEILRLMRQNPYVLTLFDVFETDDEIHLVTELCQGGELFDAIKRKGTKKRHSFRKAHFSEAQAARITYQVLEALVELHALGIVHRDIKSENVLLLNEDESDLQIKLCDFGLARQHHHHHHHHPHTADPTLKHNPNTSGPSSSSSTNTTTTTTTTSSSSASTSTTTSDGEASPQTPGLLPANNDSTNVPPEGCRGGNCGPAADIFSLGVMLYILLCGFPPVFCDTVVEFPDAYWRDISSDAKDVVRSMLHHDPCRRITAADALKKAWVRQQTTRGRRGSISANLELVRSRLLDRSSSSSNPADTAAATVASGIAEDASGRGGSGGGGRPVSFSPKRHRSSLGGNRHNKRRRQGSLMLSPKRSARNTIDISLTDLFTVSETSVAAAPPLQPSTKLAACP